MSVYEENIALALIKCEQALFAVDLIDNGRSSYWILCSSSCWLLNLHRILLRVGVRNIFMFTNACQSCNGLFSVTPINLDALL
jgi:hypothetical protein